jgi:hypothetical protein
MMTTYTTPLPAPGGNLTVENMYRIAALHQGDFDLDNCGAPVRRGGAFLDMPKIYYYSRPYPASATLQQFLDEKKQVNSGELFLIDRVAVLGTSEVSLRFTWPGGIQASNKLITVTQYLQNGEDAGAFLDPVPIPGGAWIGLEVEVVAGAGPGVVQVAFVGRVRKYLKHG